MYSQLSLDVTTEQYQLIEDKLYHLFRGRFLEAKEALNDRIHSTYRASSPVENVNGRLRVFMNVQREIPDAQFSLLKNDAEHKEMLSLQSTGADWEQRIGPPDRAGYS